MKRKSIALICLVSLGIAAGLAYRNDRSSPASANEDPSQATDQQRVAQAPITNDAAESPTDQSFNTPAGAEEAPRQAGTSDAIARWITDTQNSDPKTRATAIAALAEVPKARAVPALKQVLNTGEPQVDRQIAIRSLHVLALKQDDEDGVIRDVLRHAVYHGDDEGVTQSAQAVLEDIETEFAMRAAGSN